MLISSAHPRHTGFAFLINLSDDFYAQEILETSDLKGEESINLKIFLFLKTLLFSLQAVFSCMLLRSNINYYPLSR